MASGLKNQPCALFSPLASPHRPADSASFPTVSALLDLLQLFFRYVWIILIPAGILGLALRPVVWAVRRKEKKPMHHRVQSLLWFLQALGFWMLLIGTWMRLESVIAGFFDEPPAEGQERE